MQATRSKRPAMPVITLKVAPKVVPKVAPPVLSEIDQTATSTSKTNGLLKVAAKQKYIIMDMQQEVLRLHQMFVIPAINRGDIETVWAYLNKTACYMTTSSRCIGVKSIVDWYDNKKGERFKAHYTGHDNYLRRVKPGEEDGIYYNGKFPIRSETHKLKLDCSEAKSLEDCFEGIYPLEPK